MFFGHYQKRNILENMMKLIIDMFYAEEKGDYDLEIYHYEKAFQIQEKVNIRRKKYSKIYQQTFQNITNLIKSSELCIFLYRTMKTC